MVVVVNDCAWQTVGAAHQVVTDIGRPDNIAPTCSLLLVEDEDDMIVIETALAQQLIDTEHVGQMAVVGAAIAALYQHGILLG